MGNVSAAMWSTGVYGCVSCRRSAIMLMAGVMRCGSAYVWPFTHISAGFIGGISSSWTFDFDFLCLQSKKKASWLFKDGQIDVCSYAVMPLMLHWFIFLVLTMDQMIMCKVRWVACRGKPTENYHPTVQFPTAQWKWLNVFSLTGLVFTACNFTDSSVIYHISVITRLKQNKQKSSAEMWLCATCPPPNST